MATISTLQALSTLITSVPEWKTSLDLLNGQIAHRQIELARLEESKRPPTRSIKNKGSTESLRPRDGHENPFLSNDPENPEDIQMNPFSTPKSDNNDFTSSPRSGPITPAARTPSKVASPNPNTSPRAQPSPAVPTRQTSHPTPPTYNRPSPAILRKRKTDSIASAESQVPKYRTRSMIIVYYDKAVQDAFEDLVKFVSSSRNVMRKGKMAAKMAEMRRAAELEVDDEDDDDEPPHGKPIPDRKIASAPVTPLGKDNSVGIAVAESSDEADFQMPKLKFVSTRNMGPTRDRIRTDAMNGGGLLRGYRRAGGGGDSDIFDEVDKGLEWCQAQCERAAHQFLRDGDCSNDIANIKKRLEEVKGTAEKEIEKLKKEEADRPATLKSPRTPKREERKPLQMKSPLMRREMDSPKGLQADEMEVDDEGVDDLELPMKLVFKRSKDIVP